VIEPAAFHSALERHGLSFFTGVPDSLLKDLCAYISAHVAPPNHVIAANEGSAIALAAGHHLATGGTAVVYLQNSGIGNAINPLLSLADPSVYAIPMLLLIGWRGEPGVPDEPQHITQGRVMEHMLDVIGLPYDVIGPDSVDFEVTISRATKAMRDEPGPRAILIRRGTFIGTVAVRTDSVQAGLEDGDLSRITAIDAVLDVMPEDARLIATTGFTSREVFDHRQRNGEEMDRDFLTVGSMGHASQIALGIALHQLDRPIICLDGDGAAIMHMGGLAIIGSRAPANLHHVVINNGAHDSVGGQPTAARTIDLAGVAEACGYRTVTRVSTADELRAALAGQLAAIGPTFLEIVVRSHPMTDAARPTSTPSQNKAAFMHGLGINDA